VAYGFQKYGSQEELAKDPIKHLLEVYVKINADARQSEEMGANVKSEAQAFFRRMEEGEGLLFSFSILLTAFILQVMRKRYLYGGHTVTCRSRSMSRNTAHSTLRLMYTGVRAKLVSHGRTNV
jgi:hypothetical protein